MRNIESEIKEGFTNILKHLIEGDYEESLNILNSLSKKYSEAEMFVKGSKFMIHDLYNNPFYGRYSKGIAIDRYSKLIKMYKENKSK